MHRLRKLRAAARDYEERLPIGYVIDFAPADEPNGQRRKDVQRRNPRATALGSALRFSPLVLAVCIIASSSRRGARIATSLLTLFGRLPKQMFPLSERRA
jgi:hypothetical protein